MSLDTHYGNITQADAERMSRAAWGGALLGHSPGSTEPYVSALVASLIVATGARTVLETGAFEGATSEFILGALEALGGGTFVMCEIDPDRATALQQRFSSPLAPVEPLIWSGDVLDYLRQTRIMFDVVWLDDSHQERHVRQEIEAMLPRLNPGGLLLLHDVCGQISGNQQELGRLVEEFGGYVLDLKRMGPAGGLGVIQV